MDAHMILKSDFEIFRETIEDNYTGLSTRLFHWGLSHVSSLSKYIKGLSQLDKRILNRISMRELLSKAIVQMAQYGEPIKDDGHLVKKCFLPLIEKMPEEEMVSVPVPSSSSESERINPPLTSKDKLWSMAQKSGYDYYLFVHTIRNYSNHWLFRQSNDQMIVSRYVSEIVGFEGESKDMADTLRQVTMRQFISGLLYAFQNFHESTDETRSMLPKTERGIEKNLENILLALLKQSSFNQRVLSAETTSQLDEIESQSLRNIISREAEQSESSLQDLDETRDNEKHEEQRADAAERDLFPSDTSAASTVSASSTTVAPLALSNFSVVSSSVLSSSAAALVSNDGEEDGVHLMDTVDHTRFRAGSMGKSLLKPVSPFAPPGRLSDSNFLISSAPATPVGQSVEGPLQRVGDHIGFFTSEIVPSTTYADSGSVVSVAHTSPPGLEDVPASDGDDTENEKPQQESPSVQ